jgi:hypothetical protein
MTGNKKGVCTLRGKIKLLKLCIYGSLLSSKPERVWNHSLDFSGASDSVDTASFGIYLFSWCTGLDSVSSKFMLFHEPHKVIIFGNGVITRLRWVLSPIRTDKKSMSTSDFVRRGRETDRNRNEQGHHHVTREVEIRVTHLPAKNCQGLLATLVAQKQT